MSAHWSPPSMSALRAFESAARHLSFTRAAAELNVTQSAVSHSVRDLERHLRTSVFLRSGRRLALTEAGRHYLAFAGDALQRLRAGERAVIDPRRNARVLTVSVSPSFAAKWLVPRLGALAAAHPELDLRISANPEHIDFSDGEVDVAIRHGDGHWPDLHCTRLCEETMFPVCSARLGDPPRRPGDLARCVLIHHRDMTAWRRWFEAARVAVPRDASRGPVVNEMHLAIDAAAAGQGVALARSALVALDLAAGRLVRPIRHSMPAEFAYWIVCPPGVAGVAKIARFRAWLLAEAALTRRD